MKLRILVIDDEEIMCNSLALHLKEEKHDVLKAYSGEEALEIISQKQIDLVITDLRLGDIDGINLIKKIKEKFKNSNSFYFIIMTAYGTMEKALEAGKLGVYYFITKPFSMEQVNIVVEKVQKDIELNQDNYEFRKILNKKYNFSNIIGRCDAMQKVFEIIEKVSKIDVTVLITGESGTGKELVANAIHYNSQRKNKPLIKMNCSAFPENLLESELFGYEKGAFTGADKTHKGKFQLADTGTVFLDEIADMQLSLQAKMLRVLQNKTVEPLGSTKSFEIDVRIIAATNQELEKLVGNKEFRQDLYYRLNVVNIKLPPLRVRGDDIILITDYLIKKFNKEFNKNIKGISEEVKKSFYKYKWPGNVRELENIIQHSMVFCEGDIIKQSDLPDFFAQTEINYDFDKGSLAEVEKIHILHILQQNNYNISKAAKILKIDRKTLYNKMEKYGLSEKQKQKNN
ncbi:MAG: sigma-54-dependent transcriptional regulator [Candidatus Muiribacteriota bacterium]